MRANAASRSVAYVLALALAGTAAAFAIGGCTGRSTSSGEAGPTGSLFGDDKVVELDLAAGAPQSIDGGGFFPLPVQRTWYALVDQLRDIERSKTTQVVYLKLGGASYGWARTEELVTHLAAIRASKKKVVCHAHGLDNSATWLFVSGCDERWLSPAGGVDSVGIAAQVTYLKGGLDKLGLQADFLTVGKFKSAAEGFTREGPSDEAREALTAVLASIRGSWLEGLQKSGMKAPATIVEQGPWSPEEAKAKGLVNHVGYAAEAQKQALELGGSKTTKKLFGPNTDADEGAALAELIRGLTGAGGRMSRDHVAIVPAIGAISMSGGGPLDGGNGITASALGRTIRKLVKEKSVKAVVLRIDSPGGSALASDLLWQELKELAKEKPIVASVGSMAASGGYYLAVGCQKIVAPKTSIVGSIGVLGGKLVIGKALGSAGVNVVTFPASPEPGASARAAYLSAVDPWDAPTRERIGAQMSSVYELFLRRVSEGRKLPVDAIRKVAEGRIWSGAQGKGIGLVDEFGGLDVAISAAKKLANLDADAPVSLEGAPESLLEALAAGNGGGDDASADRLKGALAAARSRYLAEVGALPIPLQRWAHQLQPLLGNERVFAMLPLHELR